MSKISATASMGLKLKIFSDFENVSPHVSITVERQLDDEPGELSNERLVEMSGELYRYCRKFVEDEMQKDIASAKAGKDGKYIGKKVK